MLGRFGKTKSALGLDISDASLKLISLRKRGSGFDVEAYSDIPLSKEVYSGDEVRNGKRLVQIIRNTLQHPKFGKIMTDWTVASLPETKCFVRVIQIPAMSEEEAKEAIPWEAEAYIPVPIGQVYLDWVIFPKREADKKMTVLITAAPKDYVDTFTNVLKQAGLTPVALEVESQATARALVRDTNETIMIMDIDTARSSIVIYDKGVLQFTSSIPIAGNSLTEAIARGLAVPFAEAEKLKKQIGLDETESPQSAAVISALTPVLNNLVEEIKNTIRFYEEHSSGVTKISRLVLTGGSGKLKQLPSFLYERLMSTAQADHPLKSLPGLEVEQGDPWSKVLQPFERLPFSREESLGFTTAIGLAIREIDS